MLLANSHRLLLPRRIFGLGALKLTLHLCQFIALLSNFFPATENPHLSLNLGLALNDALFLGLEPILFAKIFVFVDAVGW